MLYNLMHKNLEVAVLDIDASGHIAGVGEVLAPLHLPVGTAPGGTLDGQELEDWWDCRSIPASRTGVRAFLEKAGVRDTAALLTRSMGLSLSDQYWVRPAGQDVRWEDVNFFDNPFSADVGNLLFGRAISGRMDLSSPDNTSDGILRKRWAIADGGRCLIKSGNPPYYQEPLNEAIATMLMDSQGIPNAGYEVTWMDGIPCSVCWDFVDRGTELVTAGRIVAGSGDARPVPYAEKFAHACRSAGLNVAPFLDRMRVIDFVMVNADRHVGNYGIIRDADTLEWLGPAPVYDTGTSLMCKSTTEHIRAFVRGEERDRDAPPLPRGADLGWVDADAMRGVLPRAEGLLLDAVDRFTESEMTEARAEALLALLEQRISAVEGAVASSSRPRRGTGRPSSSGGRRSS